MNKDIYKILKQVDKQKLDKLALRFLKKKLLKLKRAGVYKNAETRKNSKRKWSTTFLNAKIVFPPPNP
ncbi:MAG: hypothetical protein ACQES9_05435 [Myxococcota bacterium]